MTTASSGFSAPGDRQRLAYSDSVQKLLANYRSEPPLTSGAVVAELLQSHPAYVEKAVDRVKLPPLGEQRDIQAHLDAAEEIWDAALVPVLTGRHVVLGLALDADLGTTLVESGAIASLLRTWRPGRGTDKEPYRLVWDILTDDSRLRTDEQPLLAAAVGAPAEWTAELPADVTQLAWSPTGERLAALAGNLVFELAPGKRPHQLGEVGPSVTSLAWGGDGVVALRIADGRAELVRVPTGTIVGTRPSVTDGRVSGDGSQVWLRASEGVIRWSPTDPDTSVIGPATEVLAIAPAGQWGLVRYGNDELVVSDQASTPSPGTRAKGEPDWPNTASQLAGWNAAGPRGPRALIAYGPLLTEVATPISGGGVAITEPPWPVKARLATGAGQVTALAADAVAPQLAVAVGRRVGSWTVSLGRPTSHSIPGYDSDRASGPDLLGADRDARALAALIASRDLLPPLAIGIFGAWGSGKSFLLNRIETLLRELTRPGSPEGYLGDVKIVRFNAWQYAEANLWASLVHNVLKEIGPDRGAEVPPEVKEADALVTTKTAKGDEVEKLVKQAQTDLDEAEAALTKRRRFVWWMVAGLLTLAAIAVLAVVLGGPGRVVAAVSLALALLGSASAAYQQATLAKKHAGDLVKAGQAGIGTFGRLAGQPEELAVRAAASQLQEATNERDLIKAETKRLQAEADQLRQLAEREPLGALLHNLATVTEYRDKLTLVERTRERFNQLDTTVRSARRPGRKDAARTVEGLQIERVVIVIDDLDRCPPEKVVKVLEAVHLLFDFQMFVVVLAVDTRWLEQSLRIRYRRLLGESNTAAPLDYVEKIIQVPIQLPPLDEGLVRTMISGLARQAPPDPSDAPSEQPPDEAPEGSELPDRGQPSAVAEAGHQRPTRLLPAKVLRISPEEATALAEVASLVGTTPRTVKRFVNTYQLIKARAEDPDAFAGKDGIVDPAGVVAFLLAVLTGRAAAAPRLFRVLVDAAPENSLQVVVNALQPADPPSEDSAEWQAAKEIKGWLARHPDHAKVLAGAVAPWVPEVSRFSFAPPGLTEV